MYSLALLLPFLLQLASSLPLCNQASYPCTSCTPYAEVVSGYCYCKSGYYMRTDLSYLYCDICHSSCDTCSGPLSTNCITCADDFELDGSSCIEPNSDTNSTIVKAYSYEGFSRLSSWTMISFSTNTYQCGTKTLLGGTVSDYSSDKIRVYLTSLPAHYALRFKMNFYFLGGNTTTKNVNIQLGSNSAVPVSGSDTSYDHETCNSRNYVIRAVD